MIIRTIIIALISLVCSTASAQYLDSILYVTDSAYARAPFYANLLVTYKGQPVIEKSYGYADAVTKRPLTKDNSFQVASVSKQFTAYGIMILKNKGKLEYDDAVSKYLTDFPYPTITIRHLMHHTSGLPDFWNGMRPHMDTLHSFGNKEVLAYLRTHHLPLQFEPGSRIEYCDIGYDFLANIIEIVSGESFDLFMHKEIFKPLNMQQTFAYKVTDIERIQNKDLGIGHVLTNTGFQYAHTQPSYHFVFYLGDFYGDGSVVTTARDLAKWDQALKENRLLPETIQQEGFYPVRYHDSILYAWENVSYGFGWFIKETSAGRLIYHTGSHPGNVHGIYRYVDKDVSVFLLSNAETPYIRRIRNRILMLIEREINPKR